MAVNRDRKWKFEPDYARAPGETIAETIEALGMDQAELARRMSVSSKHVSELVNAKTSLTAEVALKLESATGVPSSLWSSLESRYREQLARRTRREESRSQLEWASQFPLSFLRKHGVITAGARDPDVVAQVCKFFGVASPESWSTHYERAEVCFRTSQSFSQNKYATAVWLRLAEMRAHAIETSPFDKQRFSQALFESRGLTLTPPRVFVPKLQKNCALCGVAVVLVPAPTGCRASGAAKWLRDDKAMIVLSLRHKTNDHFWFSFFHEAKHVLEVDRKAVFLDDSGKSTHLEQYEMRANRFASDILVPPDRSDELVTLNSATAVRSFAKAIGIAPGIVVGRMQHQGIIAHSQMNDLKQRYLWRDQGAE